jgi:hypothetical protein
MHHVLIEKEAVARVEDEPVQAVFKNVGINKAYHETASDSCKRMREKSEGDTRFFLLVLKPCALFSARIWSSEGIPPPK